MKLFSVWDIAAFSVLAVVVMLLVACGESPEAEAPASEAVVEAEPVIEEPEWPVTQDLGLIAGMEVFAQVCHHCHIDGEYVPTIGDSRQWNQRLKKAGRDGAVARDVFVKHAIEGFGDMGPRGGRRGKDLTDEQVTAAVDYMIWAVAELSPPAE